MNKLVLLILGLLIPSGILFPQVPADIIDQLDKELLEREFNMSGHSKSFDRAYAMGKHGGQMKSGMAEIGNTPDWNWVRTFTGAGGADINDIVVDGSNNVYAYGTFSDSLEIGGTTLVSVGLRDVFIAKIGSFGTITWIRSLAALPDENVRATHIALSSLGVVVTGDLDTETISGDGKSANRNGDENIFMAHISPSGAVDWIRVYDGPGTKKILTDADNNILRLTESNLRKYDAGGNLLWAAGSDGAFSDFAIHDTSIWVAGGVGDTAMWVGDSVFQWDWKTGALFFARLNSGGEFNYVEFMAAGVYNLQYLQFFIETDSRGDLYLAGSGTGDVFFRDSIIESPSANFLMKIDAGMHLKWLRNKNISHDNEIEDLIIINDDQFFIHLVRKTTSLQGVDIRTNLLIFDILFDNIQWCTSAGSDKVTWRP